MCICAKYRHSTHQKRENYYALGHIFFLLWKGVIHMKVKGIQRIVEANCIWVHELNCLCEWFGLHFYLNAIELRYRNIQTRSFTRCIIFLATVNSAVYMYNLFLTSRMSIWNFVQEMNGRQKNSAKRIREREQSLFPYKITSILYNTKRCFGA